jgi:Tol biopolymer transport system component
MRASLIRKGLIAAVTCFTISTRTAHGQTNNFSRADTSRASIGTFSGAIDANAASSNAQISRNGRFVVFESTASNLVNYVTVTPGRRHVYLLDRQAGSLEIVSINASGNEAAGNSFTPTISADGRYVAFASTADGSEFFSTNLCNDNAHVNIFYPGTHIFVRDRLANKTFLASQVTMPVQIQAGVCEGTGAQVKKVCNFTDCDLNNPAQYTLQPVMTSVVKRVAAGIVPYRSSPSTFFSATSFNPHISGDGQYVAFDTDASNLAGFTPIFSYMDPISDQSSSCTSGTCDYDQRSTSPSGGIIRSIMGFPATGFIIDSNSVRDIAVRDGKAFTTQIVSLGCLFHATGACAVQGQQASTNPQISDDGKFVSFQSSWNFLDLDFNGKSDIFLVERSKLNDEVANLDRISNNTSRLLSANDESVNTAMSADGRYIAFDSLASNIVVGDTNARRDVFVYDSKFFVTVRCGTTTAPQGDGNSANPSLDGSGNFISFESSSTNWGATAGTTNIFVGRLVRDSIGRLSACQVELATPGTSGLGGNGASSLSSIGTVPRAGSTAGAPRIQVPAISYQSLATSLHSGAADVNNASDIFQAPGCAAADLVTDTDGDATIDCFDQCKDDPLKVTDKDSDADGYPDCEEGCDTDPQKIGPGVCGCGVADTDSDSDGTPDCTDTCPNDAAKTAPGTCGCGVADVDLNANGVIDCVESSAPTNPTPVGTTPPTTSPTPSASLPTLDPGTARLERVNTRSLRILISSAINLGSGLAGYEVALERQTSTTVGERVVSTTNTAVLARNLSRGRYRARFRILNTAGQRSKWSAYSGRFTIR